MKKTLFLLFAFIILSSHDMFLKLDTYFLTANTETTIKLYNGTFDLSENVIARNRMADVSIFHNDNRMHVDSTQWSEKDSMTILSFKTKEPGTYVAGVSTKARNIELDAEAFNGYLEHDGILDMLELRKNTNTLDQDAVEKYSKHVKAIFQVGNEKTNDWQVVVGYPIEFIPLSNPYDLHTGDELQVKLLFHGQPLANHLVYMDSRASPFGHSHGPATSSVSEHSHDKEAEHSHEEGEEHSHPHGDHEEAAHDHDGSGEHSHDDGEVHSHGEEAHTHTTGSQLRTDENGIVSMILKSDGIWYLRTINLVLSDEPGLTHESNWATLTFEVGHDHSVVAAHSHEDEEALFGIPSYAYWIGSALLIGILFFWFYSKGE